MHTLENSVQHINRARLRRNVLYVPKTLLIIFALLMIFEGAVRKWIFPALGTPLQVARDILPALALLAVFVAQPSRRLLLAAMPASEVVAAFTAYFFLACVSAAISGQDSLFIALLGLRTHFAYVPLAILAPLILKDIKTCENFFVWMILVGVPVCVLTVYQSALPQSHWLNVYGTGEESNALFGDNGLVRAAGTFSYITGMGYYAQFVGIISVYLMFTNRNVRVRFISALTFAIAVMAAFSTGSRAVVYSLMLQAFMLVLFCQSVRRALFSNLKSNIILYAAVVLAVSYFGYEQFEAFVQRVEGVSDDTGWRMMDGFFEWFSVLENYPFGRGLGSGHQQAATFVGGAAGFGEANLLPESELSRVAMELGALGFVIYLSFKFLVIYFGWYVIKKFTASTHKPLAVLAFSYFVLLIVSGVYSPLANALYWFSLGVISLVRNEDRDARWR